MTASSRDRSSRETVKDIPVRISMTRTEKARTESHFGLLRPAQSTSEATLAWLEKRDCFLPTIASDNAFAAQERHEAIIPVFVPVARDGSMFLPSTKRN